MSKADKTLAKVANGTQDANLSFSELCKLLIRLDFQTRIKGGHHLFIRPGFDLINLQPAGKGQALSGAPSTRYFEKGRTDIMYEAKDYETRIWWSREDDLFVAQVLEMPGIMAHGDTRAEAAASIQAALEGALEWQRELGQEPPVPHRHQPAAA